ncbi:hypothetical protein C8Q77DRAFT_1155059 [Trametes polyzona]|nr:hypothetical protein C8Q77DRAFT_1155059 [Trametes polyzona]
MSYGYYPTPARSEPLRLTLDGRSLSASDVNAGCNHPNFYTRMPRIRRTLSVPSSFTTGNPPTWDRKANVEFNLATVGVPSSTFITRIHPRPERPRLQRQADLGLGMPLTAIHERSLRRRVAGSFPMPAMTARAHAAAPHGLGIRVAAPPGAGETQPEPERAGADAPNPAIVLTLADAFDSDGDHADADADDEGSEPDTVRVPRYSFLPPGLSSPVPWPSSPTEPLSPTTTMPAIPSATRTVRPRPMLVRTLASPGIRTASDTTPPGAPLSPSIARFGTHHHFPGLDHSAGGVADEDALFGSPMGQGGPAVGRTRTRIPVTPPPSTPRLAWAEYFGNDQLYH